MMADTTTSDKPARAKKASPKSKPRTARSAVKKKAVVKKKTVARKKSPARKKAAVSRNKVAENRKSAASSKIALASKLRADLKASKEALKAARIAAREELKLVKAVAKNEIAVLKDQLAAVIKREKELIKISKNKTAKMIAAGEKWEKQQLAKIKKTASRTRRKLSR